jgi:hypothetical protein
MGSRSYLTSFPYYFYLLQQAFPVAAAQQSVFPVAAGGIWGRATPEQSGVSYCQ